MGKRGSLDCNSSGMPSDCTRAVDSCRRCPALVDTAGVIATGHKHRQRKTIGHARVVRRRPYTPHTVHLSNSIKMYKTLSIHVAFYRGNARRGTQTKRRRVRHQITSISFYSISSINTRLTTPGDRRVPHVLETRSTQCSERQSRSASHTRYTKQRRKSQQSNNVCSKNSGEESNSRNCPQGDRILSARRPMPF